MIQSHVVSSCCKQRLLQSKQHNWLRGTSQEIRPYRSIAGSATMKQQNCKTEIGTRRAMLPDRELEGRLQRQDKAYMLILSSMGI